MSRLLREAVMNTRCLNSLLDAGKFAPAFRRTSRRTSRPLTGRVEVNYPAQYQQRRILPPSPSRATFFQQIIDRELETRWAADNILLKPHELENLRRHTLHERGYDPYNTSDALVPWVRALKNVQTILQPRRA